MSINWHSWHSLQGNSLYSSPNLKIYKSVAIYFTFVKSGISLLPKVIFCADADTEVSHVAYFRQSTDF